MCKLLVNCGTTTSNLASALVLIGAINWGLVGAFNLDVVALLFGSMLWLQKSVYILVGIAGLFLLFGSCMCCAPKNSGDKKKDGCCGGGCHGSKSTTKK
jgi:uncharacterized membrane protein YuzA (DUF378 family)